MKAPRKPSTPGALKNDRSEETPNPFQIIDLDERWGDLDDYDHEFCEICGEVYEDCLCEGWA